MAHIKAPTREIQDTEWGQTITPGTSSPTLSEKCVGSLASPANHVTLKIQETAPTVYV